LQVLFAGSIEHGVDAGVTLHVAEAWLTGDDANATVFPLPVARWRREAQRRRLAVLGQRLGRRMLLDSDGSVLEFLKYLPPMDPAGFGDDF
jgi:hypothetical protein